MGSLRGGRIGGCLTRGLRRSDLPTWRRRATGGRIGDLHCVRCSRRDSLTPPALLRVSTRRARSVPSVANCIARPKDLRESTASLYS